MDIGAQQKNTDGHLGAKCNNCGGYGYTNSILGGSLGCMYCHQTGIAEPTPQELEKQIKQLQEKIDAN